MSGSNQELEGGSGGGSARSGGVSPSEDISGDTGRHGEVDAVIGPVKLKSEFSDPDIDITHERLTAEHEVVPGHNTYTDNGVNFVVQALGRTPPEIDISCWVTQEQLPNVEDLIHQDRMTINTSRYVGEVIIREIDISYNRTYHEVHGWIFETDIKLYATQPHHFRTDDIPDTHWLQNLGADPADAPFPDPLPPGTGDGAGGS